MADPFQIDASALGTTADQYADVSRFMPAETRKRLGWIAQELLRNAKRIARLGSGGVFRGGTGTLASRLNTSVPGDDTILLRGGTVYSLIQDIGGVTRPHIIRPVHAKVLVFAVGGIGMPSHIRIGGSKKIRSLDALQPGQTAQGVAIAHEVHHPGSRIKPTNYSRKAWDATKDYALKTLAGIRDFIQSGGKS